MASRFSLSKLFGSKKKEKRSRSSSTPSPSLNLTGDTFTMRLMRPEMRAFHRERVRRESMASSSSDTTSLTSALSESAAIVTRRPSLGHATRRHSSLDDPKASARSDRRARARFYRAEVTQSVCEEEVVDESTSLSSEDQDDLLARVDKMEAELRAKRPPLPDTPTIARRSTSSDADSGLDSASVVTACSQSGGVKSDCGGGGNVGKKGVRFLFPDARIPVQYPGKRDLDLIRSDDEELDTDEEYLGTI